MKKTIHVVGAIIENEQQEIFCALRNPPNGISKLLGIPWR